MVLLPGDKPQKHSLISFCSLQKRVLRFIFLVNWRDSAIPLFVKANIPPLNMYCQSVANLVYDVVNENYPKNIRQLFLSIKDIHSYETRSAANGKLYTRPSRLKTQLNSFSRSGTRFWNSLPKSVNPILHGFFCAGWSWGEGGGVMESTTPL